MAFVIMEVIGLIIMVIEAMNMILMMFIVLVMFIVVIEFGDFIFVIIIVLMMDQCFSFTTSFRVSSYSSSFQFINHSSPHHVITSSYFLKSPYPYFSLHCSYNLIDQVTKSTYTMIYHIFKLLKLRLKLGIINIWWFSYWYLRLCCWWFRNCGCRLFYRIFFFNNSLFFLKLLLNFCFQILKFFRSSINRR